MMGEYFSVMVFPFGVLHLWKGKTKVLSPSQRLVSIQAANGKHELVLEHQFLYFLKAADNYVEVHFLSKQGMRSELMRITMKEVLEQQVDTALIMRCHRSYAVNPIKIKRSRRKGNKLELDLGLDFHIPVSNQYQAAFRKFFDSVDSPQEREIRHK
ncbi:LytTR family DNA-binding domain-containing protein [Persicobacter diffluens]|uniref:HTH LytTR-type domain-containing protein n=1 Tax=Persicobacter diffluens TaxID=981 RepID=A0AAN4W1G2_9BACT|nr:hypothetical protein PEDI_31190 [Persicobacter diffluens]